MIKCKEDLINTYIENDFGELRDLYIKKAIEFGFAHQNYIESNVDWYSLNFIGVCEGWGDDRLGQTDHDDENLSGYECRKLTLSDLKPRTRIEYEKVTESIFDLRDYFECGMLFFLVDTCRGKEYFKVEDAKRLGSEYQCGNLFLRVEKEIGERQEFVGRAKDLIDASKDADYSLGKMYDSGCRFVGANGEIE